MIHRNRLVAVKKRFHHQPARLDHDLEVQLKVNIADIIGVPLISPQDTLEAGGGAAIASDLGEAGNTGAGHIPEIIVGDEVGEFLGIFQHVRPWSYNAHLPHQDIYKLRDLIETGVAEERANTGDAGIVPRSPAGIGVIVDIHRPELIAPEGLAKEAYSLLSEQNGAF